MTKKKTKHRAKKGAQSTVKVATSATAKLANMIDSHTELSQRYASLHTAYRANVEELRRCDALLGELNELVGPDATACSLRAVFAVRDALAEFKTAGEALTKGYPGPTLAVTGIVHQDDEP